MTLTNQERETIIVFNEADDSAIVDTCNRAWINKLDKLVSCNSKIVEDRTDEFGKRYIMPKSWIKVRAPREISEQERAVLKQRAIENLGKRKTYEEG